MSTPKHLLIRISAVSVMKCPFCQIDNDKVIDSRSGEDGFAIRRRRACLNCDKRFTTFERVAEIDMRVVKKDGTREAFDSEKIRHGIERACWKRPIATAQVEQAISHVIQQVYASGEPEIDSREIGEAVMEILSRIDDVAYIRFASVYRQFKDLNEFFEEVQPILDRKLVPERQPK